MLREYIQQINEDALAQQEINVISQKIIDWLNANPDKIKNGVRINLPEIGLDPKQFKSPQIQQLVTGGQIAFKPTAEFKQLPNGAFTIDLPNASASTWFADPSDGYKYDKQRSSPWDLARSDRHWNKVAIPGVPGDQVDFRLGTEGKKLQINIPSEIATGNMNINNPQVGTGSNRYTAARVPRSLADMRSTIAHELNHQYNSLQGMSMVDLETRVERNKALTDFKAKVDAIPAGTDPATISDVDVRQAVGNRDTLAMLVKKEPELQKALTAARRSGDQAAIETATNQLEGLRQKIEILRAKMKTHQQPDPKVPTEYKNNAYWRDPVELNSRLQQSVEQMAREVRPGMTNQQIVAMIEKSFLDQYITSEFVDPAKMPKFFDPTEMADKEFRDFIRSNLKNSHPDFQKAAFNAALKDPEYRKLVNKAVKFITQQQTSPVDLSSAAGKASWSAKFRAFLTGIPQEKIAQSLLPNTWSSINIGATRLDVATDDFARQIANTPKTAINTVKATAVPAFKAGGWLLIGYVIYEEVSKAVEKYKALDPKSMNRTQYQAEVTKIITQPIARFGLGIVAGIFGAALAGTVASPTVLGVIPAAILGFAGGFAVGVAADMKYGDSVEAFVGMLVDRAYGTAPQQPSTQGFANKPQLTPASFESLERVRKLAGI
jgi:hypothetical protein